MGRLRPFHRKGSTAGRGAVWRASHRELGRDVAITPLSESASGGIPLDRFRHEARRHGTLNHPRIAPSNVTLRPDGSPVLLDFGIARGEGDTPELVRAMPAAHQQRLLLAAAAAMLTLGLGVGAATWRDDAPARPAAVGMIAPHLSLPESPAAGVLTTRIDLDDGVAEVYMDGVKVGSTPYLHTAPPGTRVTLTLRRASYRDETVIFIVSDHQREYTLAMQRDPTAPAHEQAPAVLGLLGWFRRRRRTPVTPARAVTAGITPDRVVTAPLSFRGAARTDAGCVRDGNEDAVRLVFRPDGSVIALLCDGMGGHAAGEVASNLAVRSIAEQAAQLDSSAALVNAMSVANARIRRAMARDRSLQGMGTTCVVLRLQGNTALCAHVGDSRAYLVREGTIHRLTEDHSPLRELVRDGALTDHAARHHPARNVILRALGPTEHVAASTLTTPLHLRVGDRFLLSSDGLHDLADDHEFLPALGLEDPERACVALIALARDRGAPDNVSVCVLDVMSGPTRPLSEPHVVDGRRWQPVVHGPNDR